MRWRRGTAAQWTSADPILLDGEPGYETDTGNLKVGDGSTAWTSLPYYSSAAGIPDTILDAKGDLIAASAVDTAAILPVGTDGQIIYADSGETTGLLWDDPPSGGGGIGSSELIYRYTVAGSDKASIDTGVDTAQAGSNDWTGADLLEIWVLARTDDAAAITTVVMLVNNDTTSIYDWAFLQANAGAAGAGSAVAQPRWRPNAHGSGGSSGYASVYVITMPGFSNTTFWKTASMLHSQPDATTGNMVSETYGLGYRSTSAITRFSVSGFSTAKLKVGSQLLVYKRLAS